MPVGKLYDVNVLEIQANRVCPASVLLASIGPASRSGLVPVRPELVAGVKSLWALPLGAALHRQGPIRDGVLLSVC
jgi:hypothetical protein